ncbi:hypothetical protein PvNV_097 [Penaeus vannamei nudivirus]|nr:hypothetical protein PvSNPV_097 [Penaeus vannamei nucleopolyhedrovirus]
MTKTGTTVVPLGEVNGKYIHFSKRSTFEMMYIMFNTKKTLPAVIKFTKSTFPEWEYLSNFKYMSESNDFVTIHWYEYLYGKPVDKKITTIELVLFDANVSFAYDCKTKNQLINLEDSSQLLLFNYKVDPQEMFFNNKNESVPTKKVSSKQDPKLPHSSEFDKSKFPTHHTTLYTLLGVAVLLILVFVVYICHSCIFRKISEPKTPITINSGEEDPLETKHVKIDVTT